VQSQRQWAKLATTRTTPVRFALFSLTCLIAYRIHTLTPRVPPTTAWYAKSELTFAGLIEQVRRSLRRSRLMLQPRLSLAPASAVNAEREQLIHLLASTF
jgi:hypothetical protein